MLTGYTCNLLYSTCCTAWVMMGIGRRAASGAIPPQLSNGLLRNSRPCVSPVAMRRRNPRRRCCYCYCWRGRRRRFKIVVTKIPAESAARYQKPMYNRSSIAVYENVFFLLFRSTALIHISQETFPTNSIGVLLLWVERFRFREIRPWLSAWTKKVGAVDSESRSGSGYVFVCLALRCHYTDRKHPANDACERQFGLVEK